MPPVDLICIDVDGTLLDSSGSIPEAVWKKAAAMRERGIRFALCSGRPAFGITLEYAQQLDPQGWHIFQNGASVVRPCSGETASQPISMSIIDGLIARASHTGRLLEIYGDTEYAVERDAVRTRQHAQLLGVPFKLRAFSSLHPPIVRAQWLVAHEEVDAVKAEPHEGLTLSPSLSPVMPDTTFVNMTAEGIDKGSALRGVAKAYGIPLERVMMIGDGLNDIGAMKVAGISIAMGNSEQAVIDAAQHTVGHVDEGGMLEALSLVIP